MAFRVERGLRKHGLSLLAVIGAVMVVLVAWSTARLDQNDVVGFVPLVMAHGLVYCGAVCLIAGGWCRPNRGGVILALAIGVLLRGIAMTAPPALTTDANRYVWDGRVQTHGINPYLYVPADERLAALRDDAIYPHINRKETYPTIYPPAAQLVFLTSRVFGDGVGAIKLTMLGFELIIVAALLTWLSAERLPRERILIYAWHPLPVWEFASQGHLDAAAVALVLVAIVVAGRGRQALAGAAMAAAALVKYPVALLAAALWRPWRLAMPLVMLATAALLYVPYLPGAGLKVIGSLFMHLDEEGYRDGYGFYLVGMPRHLGWPYIPSTIFAGIAAAVLLALALRIALRRYEDRVSPMDLSVLIGAYFLLLSPHYPWYYVVAVPVLCARLSPALLFVSLAVLAVYLEQPEGPLEPFTRIKVFSVMFAGAALLGLIEWLVARRKCLVATPVRHP